MLFDNVEVNLHVNVEVGVASGMILVLTNMLSGGKRACIQPNFDVDVDVDVFVDVDVVVDVDVFVDVVVGFKYLKQQFGLQNKRGSLVIYERPK